MAITPIASGSAVIGFHHREPDGTGGDFVGGTTELDDATVVPNAVYVNTRYSFLPGLETPSVSSSGPPYERFSDEDAGCFESATPFQVSLTFRCLHQEVSALYLPTRTMSC